MKLCKSLGLFIRFMADICVLAPTRWKLRISVKVVNQVLTSLRLEKYPDKTIIGQIAKGIGIANALFLPALPPHRRWRQLGCNVAHARHGMLGAPAPGTTQSLSALSTQGRPR